MIKLELKLNSELFYAGDEISLNLHVTKKTENLKLLDGSVQLLGRAIFVNEFFNRNKVTEMFGELGKIKEKEGGDDWNLGDESKEIKARVKSNTFMLPFYITRPSLLTLKSETKFTVTWTGRLLHNLPPSFIGLFCSIQHLIRVKICWKSVETGQIGCTQSEIIFKVLAHPLQLQFNKLILGIFDEATVSEYQDIEEIFPDDLKIIENENEMISKINEFKRREEEKEKENERSVFRDCDELIKEIVESDSGYKRSLSVELADGQSFNIGSLSLRKIILIPGSQIFLTLNLNTPGQIKSIQIGLECVESYSPEFLISSSSNRTIWEDSVKEIKIIPGCKDQLDLILPIPPDLLSTNSSFSCPFFNLKWQLGVSFVFEGRNFDLKIPVRLISLKFRVNKL